MAALDKMQFDAEKMTWFDRMLSFDAGFDEDVIEDGLDEDGEVDVPLTFHDFLRIEEADLLGELELEIQLEDPTPEQIEYAEEHANKVMYRSRKRKEPTDDYFPLGFTVESDMIRIFTPIVHGLSVPSDSDEGPEEVELAAAPPKLSLAKSRSLIATPEVRPFSMPDVSILGSLSILEEEPRPAGEDQCPAGYDEIGVLKSKIEKHHEYCMMEEYEDLPKNCLCCPGIQAKSKFEINVEQVPMGKCKCAHKRIYWLSIINEVSGDIIGALSSNHASVLAPLLLGGYISVRGELGKIPKMDNVTGTGIPFRIRLGANFDFISVSMETITTEQLQAFLQLHKLLCGKASYAGAARDQLEGMIPQMSQMHKTKSSEPQLCVTCAAKAEQQRKVAEEQRKALENARAQAQLQSNANKFKKPRATTAAANSIQSLLQERRQQRAREQLLSYGEKDVMRLADSMRSQANLAVDTVLSLSSDTRSQEIVRELDLHYQRIRVGQDPIGSLGALLGCAQALYKQAASGIQVDTELGRMVKIWHALLGSRSESVLSPALANFFRQRLRAAAAPVRQDF